MKAITAIFALAVCAHAVAASEVEVKAGFGLIRDIRIYTSCCNNCGMTPLGTIGVKLCGTNGCCFKADIGSSYSDCGDYFFDGVQIGECDGFDIGEITAETLQMGLYHSGTDGIRVDSVQFSFETSTGRSFAECFFDKFFLDSLSYALSGPNDCSVF